MRAMFHPISAPSDGNLRVWATGNAREAALGHSEALLQAALSDQPANALHTFLSLQGSPIAARDDTLRASACNALQMVFEDLWRGPLEDHVTAALKVSQDPAVCSNDDTVCLALAAYRDTPLLVLCPSLEGGRFTCRATLYTPGLGLSLAPAGKVALVVRGANHFWSVRPPPVPVNLLLLSGVTDDVFTSVLRAGGAAVTRAAATLLPPSYAGTDTGGPGQPCSSSPGLSLCIDDQEAFPPPQPEPAKTPAAVAQDALVTIMLQQAAPLPSSRQPC